MIKTWKKLRNMQRSLKDYLISIGQRMRALEKDNEHLKTNNEYMITLLFELLQKYNGSKRYRLNDLILSIGKFLKKQESNKDREVDLIADIIKRS